MSYSLLEPIRFALALFATQPDHSFKVCRALGADVRAFDNAAAVFRFPADASISATKVSNGYIIPDVQKKGPELA
jgi:hypothetical protein